jgi:hypothetical protein
VTSASVHSPPLDLVGKQGDAHRRRNWKWGLVGVAKSGQHADKKGDVLAAVGASSPFLIEPRCGNAERERKGGPSNRQTHRGVTELLRPVIKKRPVIPNRGREMLRVTST